MTLRIKFEDYGTEIYPTQRTCNKCLKGNCKTPLCDGYQNCGSWLVNQGWIKGTVTPKEKSK